MDVEAQEPPLQTAGDGPATDVAPSGFTAVNVSKEPALDSQTNPNDENGGALHRNIQPAYAPVGVEHLQEDYSSTQLSPIAHKRKRSLSTDHFPRAHSTTKRRASMEGDTNAPYADATTEHVDAQIQHYADHAAPLNNAEALARDQRYTHAQNESWAHQQQQHNHHHHAAHLNDDQLAEVLQRETQSDPHSHNLGSLEASPEQRYPIDATLQQQQQQQQQQQHQAEGAAPNTPSIDTQPLQKQRKRNRTKTGCLTCRERKKKCDEAKPTCNNCDRGGFYCKGYAQQAPIYKPPTGLYREPQMLQSKNGYIDGPVAYPYAPRSISGEYYAEAQQVLAANGHGSPVESREPRITHTSSPRESDSRSASVRPQWPETSAQAQLGQYSPEVMQRPEYSQIARIHEATQEQKKLPPSSVTMQPHRGSSQPAHQYTDQRVTAQLALQHPSSHQDLPQSPILTSVAPTGHPTTYATEKEKMLRGLPYQHSDRNLKKERHQCSIAVYKFNKNNLDPINVSNAERTAQFRQIVQPGHSPVSSPERSSTEVTPLAGHLGQRVEVAAPFSCDYGYNICIEDDVEISAGCTILDACPVFIGARTFLGPDVSIYTVNGDHHKTPQLPGSKRPCIAAAVTIEEDCWIGGRVIIMGGVTIGKGSTIGAGTLVTKDVPGFTTTYGDNSLRVTSVPPVWDQHQHQIQHPRTPSPPPP